jgi:hypothetical protein
MESLLLPLVAVVLYFAADAVLQAVEVRLGRRLEHRTLVFFVLLLGFALAAFAVLRRVVA